MPAARRRKDRADAAPIPELQTPLRAERSSAQARYSVKEVAEALKACAGIKSAAAAKLGCDPSTITGYFERHPELNDALNEIKESLIDLAEGNLLKNVKKGDQRAVEFYLLTQGKHRGYTKRVESTGADGKPLIPEPLRIEFVRPAKHSGS